MKICSYIGGGIRGAFSARIRERLNAAVPSFDAAIDFCAGTSAGAQNAGCQAAGIPAGNVVEMFRALSEEVFASRDWLDAATNLDELFRANYSIDRLIRVMRETLGEVTLGELDKLLLVSSFCLDNKDPDSHKRKWKPKFIHNFESGGNDRAWKLWAALVASSAAPTYFEPFLAPNGLRYIDGGMADNNPSMSAVAKAVKAGTHLEEVFVISIGTGENLHRATGGDWGYKQWVLGTGDDRPGLLLDVLFDGMIGVPDYQVAQLLGRYPEDPIGRYMHIDTVFEDPIDLADVGRLDDVIAAADALDLSEAIQWLQNRWGLHASG